MIFLNNCHLLSKNAMLHISSLFLAPFNIKQEVPHQDHNDDTTSSSQSLSESDEPEIIDNKQKKRKKVAHHSLRQHIRGQWLFYIVSNAYIVSYTGFILLLFPHSPEFAFNNVVLSSVKNQFSHDLVQSC